MEMDKKFYWFIPSEKDKTRGDEALRYPQPVEIDGDGDVWFTGDREAISRKELTGQFVEIVPPEVGG
jgi:hypothetical protein